MLFRACALSWLPAMLVAAAVFAAASPAGATSPRDAGARADASAGPAAAPSAGTSADAPADSAERRIAAFHAAADALYEAVKTGAHGEILRRLREVEARLRELPLKEIRSAEGVEALADSVAEMKRAAAAVTVDEARREAAAAALRLAADELAHPGRPMWHQYRPLLRDDIDRLERQAGAPSRLRSDEAQAAFAELAARYRLIRTAALLRGEPWKIARSDAVLTYAERLLRDPGADPKLVAGLFPPLREAMDALFPADPDAPSAMVPVYVPPPWGFSAAIGSIILTVLAWSGWRRFRFERAGGARRDPDAEPREDAASRWLRR